MQEEIQNHKLFHSGRSEVSATTGPHWTLHLPETHPRGSLTPFSLLNLDSSTSGQTSFDKASAPGALITEAEIKEDASICKARLRHEHSWVPTWAHPGEVKQALPTPKEMKAPNTVPEMVANPEVITAWISERVMSGRQGRMSRGASVYKEEDNQIPRSTTPHTRVPIPHPLSPRVGPRRQSPSNV